MVSAMRLIAPPSNIPRSTASYSSVYRQVYNARFWQAMILYVEIFVPVTWLVLFRGSNLPRAIAVQLALVLIQAFLRRQAVHVHAKGYATFAEEIWNKLFSKRIVSLIALYTLSAVVYFYYVIVEIEQLSWYKSVVVPAPAPARGLPMKFTRAHGNFHYVDEKFSYQLSFAGALAFAYSLYHAAFDVDVLRFPASEAGFAPWQRIRRRALKTLQRAAAITALVTLVWPIVYWSLHSFVHFGYYYTSILGYNIAGTTGYPGVGYTFFRVPFYWTLLVVFWDLFNVIFAAYASLGPTTKGTLVSSRSASPNGTLLNGLADTTGSLSSLMAWKELLVIGEHVADRRVSIYKDVDSERVVWKKVYDEHTKLLKALITRLQRTKAEKAAPVKPEEAPAPLSAKLQNTPSIHPSADQSIFVDQGPAEPRLARIALKFQQRPATVENKDTTKLKNTFSSWQSDAEVRYAAMSKNFLRSSLGSAFRKTTSRAIYMAIGDTLPVEYGIMALAELIVHSLDEDPVGYVQVDIASALSNLDELLVLLAEWIRNPPIDKTNVPVLEGTVLPNTNQAEELFKVAETAFFTITSAFSPYFDNLKVSAPVRKRNTTGPTYVY